METVTYTTTDVSKGGLSFAEYEATMTLKPSRGAAPEYWAVVIIKKGLNKSEATMAKMTLPYIKEARDIIIVNTPHLTFT